MYLKQADKAFRRKHQPNLTTSLPARFLPARYPPMPLSWRGASPPYGRDDRMPPLRLPRDAPAPPRPCGPDSVRSATQSCWAAISAAFAALRSSTGSMPRRIWSFALRARSRTIAKRHIRITAQADLAALGPHRHPQQPGAPTTGRDLQMMPGNSTHGEQHIPTPARMLKPFHLHGGEFRSHRRHSGTQCSIPHARCSRARQDSTKGDWQAPCLWRFERAPQ